MILKDRLKAALEKLNLRDGQPWLDDVVQSYWGAERTYHHTAPISMNFALREALRLVQEEGLARRFERHRHNAELLWDGLERRGLKLVVPIEHRLPTLTTVWVPTGIDEAAVRRGLLDEFNIEIAGGLGAFKGRVWRIGLMGYSSSRANVVLLLGALDHLLSYPSGVGETRVDGRDQRPGQGSDVACIGRGN